ncbi:hypothetical protein ACFQZ8_07360 [Micromonospora azadirachtae]|uniref:Uncharacterized protein n=1 Tax=Micromonospora azadirachtae TaxID=1970735 RepID=A0ABW2ZYP4_9ACTN
MEFLEAATVLSARLAAGDDSLAAAGAVYLAIEAWKHLGGVDPAWDRFGLEVLDVRSRLYEDDVEVDVAVPDADGPEVRAAVMDLIGHLARYHVRRAVAEDGLAQRLDHDAAAQQLRRAAAALA